MGKRQRHRSNISKHIKSSHKKSNLNRKIAFQKVDKTLKNINHIISKQLENQQSNPKQNQQQFKAKIQLQTISTEELTKLIALDKNKQKPKSPKINIDESLVLQKMIKKWEMDFTSMAKDIKLNKMQWTAKQIQKKNKAYQKLLEQQQKQLEQ